MQVGKLIPAALAALFVMPTSASAETIGVALASSTNPFYIAMQRGIEERAAELGHEVVTVSVDEDVVAQVDGVLDLVARDVDGILISPIDAVATNQAYEAAHNAGIPIVSIARHSTSEFQTLFVAMDEVQIGRDIANWLIDAIGGEGEVAMIAGPSGAATFRNLAEGFREVVDADEAVEIVFETEVPLTREDGLRVAEDILVAHPEVDGIYGGNDELALGAAQAVGAVGMTGDVVITGMNGVPPAMAAVRNGEIGLTVQLNPVAWGQLGVDTMDAIFEGDMPEQRVFIDHRLVDADNVE
jgi:ribose transport system substrate-binding protein